MTHRVITISAAADKAVYGQFDTYLSTLKADGLLVHRSVHDCTNDAEVRSAMDDADMVFVLLTPALVTSPSWNCGALQHAKGLREARGLRVIPIVMDACDWTTSWLGDLQALPRGGQPLLSRRNESEAWTEVIANLRAVLKGLQPRSNDARHAMQRSATADAPVEVDLADVRLAYRRLDVYHAALLRLIDATQRATEEIIGPLEGRAWEPGVLLRPGGSLKPIARALLGHIPLRYVSYVWTSSWWLSAGSCRVVVVHQGDDGFEHPLAGGEPAAPAVSNSTLSAFVTCVVHPPPDDRHKGWHDVDGWVASAPEFSLSHWRDGEMRIAKTTEAVVRFGGVTRDITSGLFSNPDERWISPLRSLISKVKGH